MLFRKETDFVRVAAFVAFNIDCGHDQEILANRKFYRVTCHVTGHILGGIILASGLTVVNAVSR